MRCARSTRSSRSTTRRSFATPTSPSSGHERRRPAGGLRPREGRHLRQARRDGRHPRQRRRALDVDRGRRRRRRRAAGELLRPRRRRLGRGCRRRARGDLARSAGALDPVQHLRRDHPLRRGRARHPDRSRADRPGGADRRAPRRDERRRGSPDPRRGSPGRTSTSSRPCSTPPAAPWSWPHEARPKRQFASVLAGQVSGAHVRCQALQQNCDKQSAEHRFYLQIRPRQGSSSRVEAPSRNRCESGLEWLTPGASGPTSTGRAPCTRMGRIST